MSLLLKHLAKGSFLGCSFLVAFTTCVTEQLPNPTQLTANITADQHINDSARSILPALVGESIGEELGIPSLNADLDCLLSGLVTRRGIIGCIKRSLCGST
ncbi:hypothetical protein F5X98DRAFT_345112 [Xylaria grammica]|nr:hypothetical protein F5X98DRAFT_345112 [Xylaria grammica]